MLTTSHWIIWYLLSKNKWKHIWIYGVIWAILPDIPMILSLIVFYTSNSKWIFLLFMIYLFMI